MTCPCTDAPDLDPQCPWLLQRIDELKSDLTVASEPMLMRHWRRQLRVLTERARCLGCLSGTRPRPGIDAPPP